MGLEDYRNRQPMSLENGRVQIINGKHAVENMKSSYGEYPRRGRVLGGGGVLKRMYALREERSRRGWE